MINFSKIISLLKENWKNGRIYTVMENIARIPYGHNRIVIS